MPSSRESSPSLPSSQNVQSKVKPSFFHCFRNKTSTDSKPSVSDATSHTLPPVKYIQLFKYATRKDCVYTAFATLSSIIHGGLLPLFTIVFGAVINEFGGTTIGSSTDPEVLLAIEEITYKVGAEAKWFLIFAAVAFVTSIFQVRLQLIAAQQIGARLRRKFFQSLMSQDYTWYDENNGGELTARVAGDVNLIQAGIGDKFTSAVQFVSTFFFGIIIAFIYGPLLTLVILSVAPLIIFAGVVFGKIAADSTGDGLGAYGAAGAVATEVIGLIRTVTAYNGQETEAKRYEEELQKAYKADCKKSIVAGLGLGCTMFIITCTYCIAFLYGSHRARETILDDGTIIPGSITAGDLLTTFFSVIIACISIGQAAPSFTAFVAAKAAAPRVYEIIERESDINPLNHEDGDIISDFTGHVEFKNVDFNYKTRVIDDLEDDSTSEYVLNNFNLVVPPGSTHALVGESGCGKSTTVRLIERFYDVQNGEVLLDGRNVRDLNVCWLRSQMGYVGQMPTLFALSIRDNIAMGAQMVVGFDEKTSKRSFQRKGVSDSEIISAAKQANAHDFIMNLPEKYETILGERGALLSGGQKQRVCIARALIRNPKILILDESTAALDSESERIVQSALEQASTGRTTISIAHRLSTVKKADTISVISKGSVVESGSHTMLLDKDGGAYRALVEHQNIEAEKINVMSTENDKESRDGYSNYAAMGKTSLSKTVGDDVESDGKVVDEKPDVDKGVLMRAFKQNAREWPLILFGIIGAGLAGITWPILALVFSDIISEVLGENRKGEVRKLALYFVAIGGGSFLGNFLQLAMLGISGERLTRKLRRASFQQILRQDMGFFDMKENSLGSLTTRLATEASYVKGITGDTLGGFSFALSTVICGLLVAFSACWRVALVVTGIFPFMAVSGAVQLKMMTGFDADSEKRYAKAGSIVVEAVDNFDTVTAIGVQDEFMDRHNKELNIPMMNGRKTALIGGIAFGCSEFLAQALWAVCFWIGSIFVRDGFCTFSELMKAITGLLFAGMMLGQVSTYFPDVTKSRVGATNIFRLLDTKSKIDPTVENDTKADMKGTINCKDLWFEYPTRPDVGVLRGLSVEIKKGKTLALVGASGCGKSTIVAMLERFYDARRGEIQMDGLDTKKIDVKWMRKHVGLVSQEPDLFNRSVRDNIAYGLDHKEGTVVTENMIIQAAQRANAHQFISELSEGYDTIVGARGSRLSGGQRQRVAIARAVIREPTLLLLDEATSALDAVSEKVVQEALDEAGAERTTVAIAHRLSTVKGADAIGVVKRGKIVELGTHEQLLRIENGEYGNLIKNQLAGQDD